MIFSQLFKRKKKVQDADRKKAEVRHGANLHRLKESAEWADLIQVKEWVQDNSATVSVNPSTDDRTRLIGAVEYATLHNFFLEVSRRIKVGEDSQKELEELVKK